MITYGYQQQLYKLRPLQIILLAFLTCCDFLLLSSFIASIIFANWADLGWTIFLIILSIFAKIATTFCMKKIIYKYSNKTLEVKLIFPYYNKSLLKCCSNDIKELTIIFDYADNRIESENGKISLSKLQHAAMMNYVKEKNIKSYTKAYICSSWQNIYMLKLINNKVYFVAIDEFMKSLLCDYEEKIMQV